MNKFVNKIRPIVFIVFFIVLGFITGVIWIALWKENRFLSEGILDEKFIRNVEEMVIDKRAMFILCLGEKMRSFVLLFLLSFSSVNFWVTNLFFLISGVAIGSIVEVLIIRYGMQGILMYLTMIIPQGLFYGLGFILLGCWCLQNERNDSSLRNKKVQKIKNLKKSKAIFASFFLLLIGVFLESYVNPKIFLFFI